MFDAVPNVDAALLLVAPAVFKGEPLGGAGNDGPRIDGVIVAGGAGGVGGADLECCGHGVLPC